MSDHALTHIAQVLIRASLLEPHIATQCQTAAALKQQSLIHYLVEHHVIDALRVALFLSTHFHLPIFDLNSINITQLPFDLLSLSLIHKHRVLPLFKRDNQLFIAIDDPSDTALKTLQFHTPLQLKPVIVESDKLHTTLLAVLKQLSGQENHPSRDRKEAEKLGHQTARSFYHKENLLARSDQDEPVISLVQQILNEALLKQASDIHFEPYETFYRIRYRIDGLLTEVAYPSLALAPRITARLKILAQLNTAERRFPQDGRFHIEKTPNHPIECRVSTCPTTFGEKIVIRLLDPHALHHDINELGLDAQQKTQFLKAIQRPLGLVIVTGPTGSGKSFTLYHALSLLNKKDVNICSVEDPVEIKIPGINQVNHQPTHGLSFSNVLRTFLRQDPDIMMIGEIRDSETAEIAVSAAQTGHLVLSTLHTNTALETLTRLKSMGISNYHLANSLTFVMAQRLVRKLCEHCKVRIDTLSLSSLIALGYTEHDADHIQLHRAQGCAHCTNGYKGRMGLFELLSVNQEMEQFILADTPISDIREHLEKNGMKPLYRAGLEKVHAGLTTIEELHRVVSSISL